MGNEWNVGQKGPKGLKKQREAAILVGLVYRNQTEEQVIEYLDELEFLALTAGAETVRTSPSRGERIPHPSLGIPALARNTHPEATP